MPKKAREGPHTPKQMSWTPISLLLLPWHRYDTALTWPRESIHGSVMAVPHGTTWCSITHHAPGHGTPLRLPRRAMLKTTPLRSSPAERRTGSPITRDGSPRRYVAEARVTVNAYLLDTLLRLRNSNLTSRAPCLRHPTTVLSLGVC